MAGRQILGLGGGGSTEEETRRFLAPLVGLAGKSSPKVCVVPTAVGDDGGPVLRLFGQLPEDGRPSYLPFFPLPPGDPRGVAPDPDVVFVGGGNTADAL